MAQQVAQKGNGLLPSVALHLFPQVQFAAWCDGADRRHVVSCQVLPDNGRLPTGGIGADDRGCQVEAAFVDKEDCPPLVAGFFLSAGQSVATQLAIAVSSRWVARLIGFCGVHSSALRMRPT